MLPALRLGFVVTPPSLSEAVQKAKQVTDWHTPTSLQLALARFMNEGEFARHLHRVRRVYSDRHQIVTNLLLREMADQLEVIPSTVGLHVAALARRATADELTNVVIKASEVGVELQQLSMFAVKPLARPGLVIGYGAIPTDRIEEGLRLLRRCFLA
jgi:GntR family transcriptional regulator/MocR family aminotransferase